MQPSDNNYQAGSELPRPNTEATGFGVPEVVNNRPVKAEQASKGAELPQFTPLQESSNAAQPLAGVSPQSSTLRAPEPLIPQATSANAPDIAEDNDLIEQEWVHKAKAIVERTRDDPHLQNKEMNKFKASYIKKRYNKEIKVNED